MDPTNDGSTRDPGNGLDSLDQELSELVRNDPSAPTQKVYFGAEGWRLDHGRWICTRHTQAFCEICAALAPSDPPPERLASSPHGAEASQTLGHANSDLTSQLERLAQLHERGMLDDREFTTAKRKLLGS